MNNTNLFWSIFKWCENRPKFVKNTSLICSKQSTKTFEKIALFPIFSEKIAKIIEKEGFVPKM